MQLKDALAMARELHPCAYDDRMLTRWVSELDGRIRQEIMGVSDGIAPYDAQSDMEITLAAPFPHDGIYMTWLGAKIDFAGAEYDRYNNGMLMFNAEWDTLAAAWVREHGGDASKAQYAKFI